MPKARDAAGPVTPGILPLRLDLEGRCVLVNRAVQTILGWPPPAVMSAPRLRDVMGHPDDWPETAMVRVLNAEIDVDGGSQTGVQLSAGTHISVDRCSKDESYKSLSRVRAWSHTATLRRGNGTCRKDEIEEGKGGAPLWNKLLICQVWTEGDPRLFHGSHLLQPEFLLPFQTAALGDFIPVLSGLI
jgi:PAS domain-containing protein